MTEREMNALADLLGTAKASVETFRQFDLLVPAKQLQVAIDEMEAATKEADGE